MQLPFVPRPSGGSGNWAQAEYVVCMKKGIGFSAHADYWHYRFKDHCESLTYDVWSDKRERIVHTFEPGLDWIAQCVAALAKLKGSHAKR